MKLLKLFFLCLLLALLPPNSHAATGDYTLVTNASDLQAGDKIVMVGVNVKFSVRFAMSTEQKSSNRGAVNNLSGFSDNNTKLSLNNPSVQEIELQNGTENWHFMLLELLMVICMPQVHQATTLKQHPL